MIYGYARISTNKQSIDRQIRNIVNAEPSAKIIEEVYTGTSIVRPKFEALLKHVKSGDTIVFDSVSQVCMSIFTCILTVCIILYHRFADLW